MVTYTTFQVNDGIVSLGDGGDHERIFPLSMVTTIGVDWTRRSGVLSFTLATGGLVIEVTFMEPDGGQECSDAISDIFSAWRKAAAPEVAS